MKKNLSAINYCILGLSLLFFLHTTDTNAQTGVKPQTEPKGSQTTSTFPKQEVKMRQQQVSTPATNASSSVYFLDENDEYQGRKAEILNVLTIDNIPADFPKYQKGKGIQWYNDQIDNYYRLHPSVLKDQYRQKLGI